MDNNVNVFELTCNQYIILELDTYKISHIIPIDQIDPIVENNETDKLVISMPEVDDEIEVNVKLDTVSNPGSDDNISSDEEYVNIKEPDKIISFFYSMFS
jgi:hypothetical protein